MKRKVCIILAVSLLVIFGGVFSRWARQKLEQDSVTISFLHYTNEVFAVPSQTNYWGRSRLYSPPGSLTVSKPVLTVTNSGATSVRLFASTARLQAPQGQHFLGCWRVGGGLSYVLKPGEFTTMEAFPLGNNANGWKTEIGYHQYGLIERLNTWNPTVQSLLNRVFPNPTVWVASSWITNEVPPVRFTNHIPEFKPFIDPASLRLKFDD